MNNRWRTKHDAIRSRVLVYVCKNCGTQHPGKKPSVCSNDRCRHFDFFKFDSKAEAMRFATLMMLQNHGRIKDLRLQVPFPVYHVGDGLIGREPLGKPMFRYYADFTYRRNDGTLVVEDVKGDERYMTDLFKLKRKIIEALYELKINVV